MHLVLHFYSANGSVLPSKFDGCTICFICSISLFFSMILRRRWSWAKILAWIVLLSGLPLVGKANIDLQNPKTMLPNELPHQGFIRSIIFYNLNLLESDLFRLLFGAKYDVGFPAVASSEYNLRTMERLSSSLAATTTLSYG
ncbi:hypothetical protein M9H77_22616 [Catharanthus roseus]|uniref:Uncharacterized protein n=1 Tax=Catharanthus roseus TaxID=4058 RepID=A0ACC0AV24_CATRO|nr:hypothetical protein M9H77_22616 [Catharanthus roseus]